MWGAKGLSCQPSSWFGRLKSTEPPKDAGVECFYDLLGILFPTPEIKKTNLWWYFYSPRFIIYPQLSLFSLIKTKPNLPTTGTWLKAKKKPGPLTTGKLGLLTNSLLFLVNKGLVGFLNVPNFFLDLPPESIAVYVWLIGLAGVCYFAFQEGPWCVFCWYDLYFHSGQPK